MLTFGIPQQFLVHGSREEVLEEIGLTAARASLEVLGAVLSGTPVEEESADRPA